MLLEGRSEGTESRKSAGKPLKRTVKERDGEAGHEMGRKGCIQLDRLVC